MQLHPPTSASAELQRVGILLYLLRAVVYVGLPYFARPPFDDCVAEHCDDHDKQEVACVHQMQIDEGSVILEPQKYGVKRVTRKNKAWATHFKTCQRFQ